MKQNKVIYKSRSKEEYMKRLLSILAIITLLASGCITTPETHTKPYQNIMYQLSTINALLAGNYDSNTTYSEVLQHGDFGIGVFNSLDGEMVLLDGTLYQIKSDGNVYRPDSTTTKTPFATVCHFKSEKNITIKSGATYKVLKQMIDKYVLDQDQFCAIKITGQFKTMTTRTVPRQSKPYPPISYITKNEPIFNLTNISGTIVGFRNPSYAKGMISTGYHLHFITDDENQGGHVMSFEVEKAECELDFLNKLHITLPDKVE